MVLIELDEREREELNEFIKRAGKKNLVKRALIIINASESENVTEVARKSACEVRKVKKWIKRYKEKAIEGLYNRKGAGAPAIVSKEQVNAVVSRRPSDFGIASTVWVSSLIYLALVFVYGKSVGTKRIRQIMHQLNYRWKRAKVERKVRRPLPASARESIELSRQGKVLTLFIDQTCVRLLPHIAYGWGKVGQVLRALLPDKSSWNQSFYIFGAVNILTGKFIYALFDHANAQNFKIFLQGLIAEIKLPIHIILDQASYHTAKIIKDFVYLSQGKITLIFLPARSPQLNPIERVWKHIKSRLANFGFATLEQKKLFCADILLALNTAKILSLTKGWRQKYAKNC